MSSTSGEQVGTIGQSLLQRLEEPDATLAGGRSAGRRRLWSRSGPAIHDLRADPDLDLAADLQERRGRGRS